MRRTHIRLSFQNTLLAFLMFLAGNLAGCTGGSLGPGGPGNSGAPGALTPPGGIPMAAAPGQQPTEWGTVGEQPPFLLINVASPDGTVDVSTDIVTAYKNFQPVDDSHCATPNGNQQIFPEQKPMISVTQTVPPQTNHWTPNACGQIIINCYMADPMEGKNILTITAALAQKGWEYHYETKTVECTQNDYPPLILYSVSKSIGGQLPAPEESVQLLH